jgi:hypothetical protein
MHEGGRGGRAAGGPYTYAWVVVRVRFSTTGNVGNGSAWKKCVGLWHCAAGTDPRSRAGILTLDDRYATLRPHLAEGSRPFRDLSRGV